MVELILEFSGLAADEASIAVKTILRWLIRFCLVMVGFFVIGWLTESPALLKTSITFLFTLIATVIVVISFAAAVAKIPSRGTGAIQHGMESLSGALFWLLSLGVVFAIFPVWEPGPILLLFLLSLIIVLGYIRWGMGPSPKWAIFRTYAIFIGTLLVLLIPSLRTVSFATIEIVSEGLERMVKAPKEIQYDASNIDQIPLYDTVRDKPIVWWGRDEQGKYHLYNGPGFNPFVRGKLQEPTPDLKQKIKAFLTAKAKEEEARLKKNIREIEEEIRKAAEQQRAEREKEEKRRAEEEKKRQAAAEAAEKERENDQDNRQTTQPGAETTGSMAVETGKIVVPTGTTIPVRLLAELDTIHNRVGDEFKAYLDRPVIFGGETIIKEEALAYGAVTDIRQQSAPGQSVSLAIGLYRLAVTEAGKDFVDITTKPLRFAYPESKGESIKKTIHLPRNYLIEFELATPLVFKEHRQVIQTSSVGSTSQAEGVYAVGGGVIAPVAVRGPSPSYTKAARQARIEGKVLLLAIIRKDGTVGDFKVIRGLGYGLDESAINTIATKWRFRPGTLNGQPVDVQCNVEVSFKLY